MLRNVEKCGVQAAFKVTKHRVLHYVPLSPPIHYVPLSPPFGTPVTAAV